MQTNIPDDTLNDDNFKLLDNSYSIEGRTGKGGGGGLPPIEFYDTQRSTQVVKLLIAVSEGVCEELTDV